MKPMPGVDTNHWSWLADSHQGSCNHNRGVEAMREAYVQCFAAAVENVFSTMVQTQVTVRPPVPKPDQGTRHDVSGIIGLSGDLCGMIVLSFPKDVAEQIASSLTSMPMDINHEDFADAIGELVNMVSGNAKAGFDGKNCSISCPSVVVGKGHTVFRQRGLQSIELPCECQHGAFHLELALRETAN